MTNPTLLTAVLLGLLSLGTAQPTGAHAAARAGPTAAAADTADTAAPAASEHFARPPVRVVATLPVYAELAKRIGGDEVEVSAIADPAEDAHFVRPRPSFALRIRQADMLITTGLDLELWLPGLLDRAGNAQVSEGGPGYVTAYTGVTLLDIPESTDRSQGDIHVYGNPHVYTDPLNAVQVARNITSGLKSVAPDRSERFDQGLARFTDQVHRRLFGDELVEMLEGPTLAQLAREGALFPFLEETEYEGTPLLEYLGGWLARAAPFRGESVICYHKNWAYFENRFQVECADYVEAKPGIPPTPGHVGRLIDMMTNQGIGVVFAANYFDRSQVERVADRAGARAVIVPMEPGGAPGADGYFNVVDTWVGSLAEAFRTTS